MRALEATIDGRPLPPEAVRIGDGAPWRGGTLSAAALTADHRPTAPDGPALRLWRRDLANPGVDAALDAEVEESLRALGYIQ